MIHLFGNCQTGFLAKALEGKGVEVAMHCLASPLTFLKGHGSVPHELDRLINGQGLQDYLYDRPLETQFTLLPKEGLTAEPELFVFNLFHETEPLFVHQDKGYVFYVDPTALSHNPDLDRFIREECGAIRPNPATFLSRFASMVEGFRKNHPGTPILVFTRLSPRPAFGPEPFSYLACWEQIWPQALAALEEWAATLENTHILDMDRVFAGIWNRGEQTIEAHCPFLRFFGSDDDAVPRPRRDLEHVGSMWPRLAEKILGLRKLGQVTYDRTERPPLAWSRGAFLPEELNQDRLMEFLGSGGNYPTARALGHFIFNPEQDQTPLLAACAEAIPVCHNTLHMLKHYGRMQNNPLIALVYEDQLHRATKFTDNGEAYRTRYVETLEELLAEARGYTGQSALTMAGSFSARVAAR